MNKQMLALAGGVAATAAGRLGRAALQRAAVRLAAALALVLAAAVVRRLVRP